MAKPSLSEDSMSSSPIRRPQGTMLVVETDQQQPFMPAPEKRLVAQPMPSTTARLNTSATPSSRRPRAQSLKAREAAGLAGDEGAQLMNKQMKKEMAKKKKVLKEQRKAAGVAGLRRGEVFELLTEIVVRDGDESPDRVLDVASPRAEKETWRKLTPDELLQNRALDRNCAVLSVKRQRTGAEIATLSEPTRQVTNATRWEGDAAVSTTTVPWKGKRARGNNIEFKVQDCYEEKQYQTQHQTRKSIANIMSSSWRAAQYPASSVCQFAGCSERATFGVNAFVRYW